MSLILLRIQRNRTSIFYGRVMADLTSRLLDWMEKKSRSQIYGAQLCWVLALKCVSQFALITLRGQIPFVRMCMLSTFCRRPLNWPGESVCRLEGVNSSQSTSAVQLPVILYSSHCSQHLVQRLFGFHSIQQPRVRCITSHCRSGGTCGFPYGKGEGNDT